MPLPLFRCTYALFALISGASAETIFVDAQLGTGSNDGSDWDNALQGGSGLQAALQQAVAGDRIFVAEGTYWPSAAGLQTDSFVLQSGVELYGGFRGGESSPAERPPFGTVPSVLSGDLAQDDASSGNAENSIHVVTSNSPDTSALLDGFRVTAGNATGLGSSANDQGGGMRLGSGHAATVRNCEFVNNAAERLGGGLYASGQVAVENTTFADNFAGFYGGAVCDFSIVGGNYDRCRIRDNRSWFGGGMCTGVNTAVTNCLISGNVADVSLGAGGGIGGVGGGVYTNSSPSNAQFVNCTIVDNRSTNGNGAGMYVESAGPAVGNCILWGNQNGAGQMGTTAQVFIGQDPTVSHCLVQGGALSGVGNLAADPEFVDPAAGDYRLQSSSPAIDAGNNDLLPAARRADLDERRRIFDLPAAPDVGSGTGPLIDMGTYETSPLIGTLFCLAATNSTGAIGRIDARGSAAVAANDLRLEATQLPNGVFGFFLVSRTEGFSPLAGGGAGTLCLGGAIGRYVGPGQVQNSGTAGSFELQIDLSALPGPLGSVAVMPGDEWLFQAWHRDAQIGQATSNFTDGLRVRFE